VGFLQGTVLCLGLGTLIAAAAAGGRQRFLSEPDLFPGTPLPPPDRVLGVALDLAAPAVVTGAVLGLLAAVANRPGGFRRGSPGHDLVTPPAAADWLLPVLLADWLLPVLLVVLAGVAGLCIAELPGRAWWPPRCGCGPCSSPGPPVPGSWATPASSGPAR
jgi:hypothetical protein